MSEATVRSFRRLSLLLCCAAVVGAGTGFLAGMFRLVLEAGANARELLLAALNGWGFAGLAVFAACGMLATSIAAWIVVRFAPTAAGSGIPRVQSVLEGELPPAPGVVIPVKFVAASLGISSGLALGREGPSVQMGTSLSYYLGKILKQDQDDCRSLMIAGGAAGLAAAFNAPLAGAVFAIEVLLRRFEASSVLATLMAVLLASITAGWLVGNEMDYPVGELAAPPPSFLLLFGCVGIAIGLLSVVYNVVVAAGIQHAGAVLKIDYRFRAAGIGAVAMIVAWHFPWLVGGGDGLAREALAGSGSFVVVSLVIVARLTLIILSVSAGVPGGLLAPLLSLGAQAGLWTGLLIVSFWPQLQIENVAFAVVGMAGLFAGTIRAPITAFVLVVEVTGASQLAAPLLITCVLASATASALGNRPLLDTLRSTRNLCS